MSKTQSAAVVTDKIQNLRKELADAGSTEQKFASYDKYNVFLTGLRKGMEISGAGAEDMVPVDAALSMINKQIDALEAEAALDEALVS